MMAHEPAQSGQRGFLWRLDQLSVAVVVAVSLVIVGVYGWKTFGWAGGVIDVERDVEFQVDVNEADWPELMVLPEIGESRARQIVQWRRDHGQFASHEDLLEIPGIGQKTLAKIRRYLRPIPLPRSGIGT